MHKTAAVSSVSWDFPDASDIRRNSQSLNFFLRRNDIRWWWWTLELSVNLRLRSIEFLTRPYCEYDVDADGRPSCK